MTWFDFGGVLSPSVGAMFRSYEQKTGITPSQLQSAILDVADDLEMESLAPIELAVLSEAEWFTQVIQKLNKADPGLDLSRCETASFGKQWFAGLSVNQPMVAAAHRAKEYGLKVGILTNNVVEWEPHWYAMVGLHPGTGLGVSPQVGLGGCVDTVIDSCRVGLRKPDPKIFQLAAESAGVPSEQCLLVDDLEENCSAAVSSGWQAIQFLDNEQALRDLQARTGLPIVL
jgi:putative hydrolase of the HAD superfamily